MAGTQATIALAATEASPEVYAVPAGGTIRLITPSSSTAKLEVSYDGGLTFKPWAFGTQAASLTKSEVLLRAASVKATSVTGTATFEVDLPADTEAHSRVLVGLGTPASLVAAPIGTLYVRTDGAASTTLYLKTTGTGTSGWTAVASS